MLVFMASPCSHIRTPSCLRCGDERTLTLTVAANLQKFISADIYRRGGCRHSAALRGLKQVLPREANMKIISLRFAEGEKERRNGRITHASATDRLSWSAVEWARATWHFWVIDLKVARGNTFDFTSCQLQCVCAYEYVCNACCKNLILFQHIDGLEHRNSRGFIFPLDSRVLNLESKLKACGSLQNKLCFAD